MATTSMVSSKRMDMPGPDYTEWKGKKILESNYSPDRRQYEFVLQDGTTVWLDQEMILGGLDKVIEKRGHTYEEFEEIKKSFERTIRSVNEAYERKLNDERELRAKDEERIKHLQDEVFNLRRELQRRHEQDCAYTVIGPGVVSTYPTDPLGTAVPPGWPYTGSSGISTGNDTV